MNTSNLISYRPDLFVASADAFAIRLATLPPLPVTQALRAMLSAAEEPEEDTDLEDEDDDEFDDEDTDDEGDDDAEQTAEPEGEFPGAPDTLTDTVRPGAPQNRHGDRGGVS
jgi:hypothetical protein